MKFKVPPYSQFLDVKNHKWQRKSCGIVSLKMLLDYWSKQFNKTAPSISKLIQEGVKNKGYIPNIGWRHKNLVELVEDYGFGGNNFDWAKVKPSIAFKKLRRYLNKYPLMASIYKNFCPGDNGHLVVITDFKNNFIFYNDPDSKYRKDVAKKIGLKKFLKGWKKRIIIIYPRKVAIKRILK